MPDKKQYRPGTIIAHGGLKPSENQGIVNPPLYRASTILFPTVADLKRSESGAAGYKGLRYGISGTPTTFALCQAVAEVEEAAGCLALSSGLSAIVQAILGFVKSGDHILVTDSVYGPTRRFCDQFLKRFGVRTDYYPPLIGDGITKLIKPNTKLVFTESPGSLTFEVQDIPAIAHAAHKAGAVVLMDNTWATPLFFKPFRHGVDVSIHAGTKYIGGHSDLLLGLVTAADERHLSAVRGSIHHFGDCVAPDVCWLALRGIRSMAVRLANQQKNGLRLARWLQEREEVKRVLHPALSSDPGHEIWKRDFTGSCGLFGFILHTNEEKAISAMIDGLDLFGIGYSWGGFESLILPAWPEKIRSTGSWSETGQLVRINVGMEDVEDLMDDLAAGFDRLNEFDTFKS